MSKIKAYCPADARESTVLTLNIGGNTNALKAQESESFAQRINQHFAQRLPKENFKTVLFNSQPVYGDVHEAFRASEKITKVVTDSLGTIYTDSPNALKELVGEAQPA